MAQNTIDKIQSLLEVHIHHKTWGNNENPLKPSRFSIQTNATLEGDSIHPKTPISKTAVIPLKKAFFTLRKTKGEYEIKLLVTAAKSSGVTPDSLQLPGETGLEA